MQYSFPNIKKNILYILLLLAVLVNFSGLFSTILGTDGTLYACIAKTMAKNNDFINLYNEGKDWLDKPHFPFWITAISFKLFGFTNVAYKLPGILFMMMGACYTYLLAKKLYNKQIALWSAIILLTAEHIVISNNDVRAEPYLTGFIIAAIFHFYSSYTNKKFIHLLFASAFTACAIMTKGLFAVIPIGGAIAGELIITKNWKELFNARWLVAMLLTLLFISPELYALYMQFDMHPEKIIYGEKGFSGLKFFFWDSQFGRFLNTGPIKGKGDIFFFFHTLLWAFLPWSVLLYAAFFYFFKTKARAAKNNSWLCACGSLLTFLVFSVSKFQLPYYLNIVFPMFAIIAAQYLFSLQQAKTIRAISIIQNTIAVIILLLSFGLILFFQPTFSFIQIILFAIIFFSLLSILFLKTSFSKIKILCVSVLASVFANLLMNVIIYPELYKYQSGSEAAFWINKNFAALPVLRMEGMVDYALEFYLKQPLDSLDTAWNKKPPTPFLLVANDDEVKKFQEEGRNIKVLQTFDDYHISMLTGKFINKKTRATTTQKNDVAICY